MAAAIAALLVVLCGMMTAQHLRYLKIRREIVQDRQPILYSASAFHVVTFLDVPEGADVVEGVRRFHDATQEAAPDAILVYAGQAAFTRPSTQLGERTWDAVALVQYDSREAYDAAAASSTYQEAVASFEDHYSHGMQRSPVFNLLFPQALLLLRTIDLLRGNWSVPELEENPATQLPEEIGRLKEVQAGLLRLRPLNDEAVVVFNLIQPGSPEQQAADRSYGIKMITRMAGLAHGPMHIGRAVAVEGDARFQNVVIVYYPGVSYFARLLGSRFFQGIIGDKQLGDTQAVPTVPILSRLSIRPRD